MGMISRFDINNPSNYAYVGGCRNVAWLTGKIVRIDTENRIIYLTRMTNDRDSASLSSGNERVIPIYYGASINFPEWVKPGNDIRTICHIYSGAWPRGKSKPTVSKNEGESTAAKESNQEDTTDSLNFTDSVDEDDGGIFVDVDEEDILSAVSSAQLEDTSSEPSEDEGNTSFIRLVVKYIGRPELSDYTNLNQLANNIIEAQTMDDLIKRGMIFSRASNYFEVAGFIETKPVRAGGSDRHLRFVLRQGANDRHALMIDLIGKTCNIYRKNIQPSIPILVRGSVVAGISGKTNTPVALLRAENISSFSPDRDDFTFSAPPDWAKAIRARVIQLAEQERQRQAALERKRRMLGLGG